MLLLTFLNIHIAETFCDEWTDLYVFDTGKNIPGCGIKAQPCQNLTTALTEYHRRNHKDWLECVTVHLDSSQSLNEMNKTELVGIGNPLFQYGSHTTVQVFLSAYANENVSLEISSVRFEHIILQVRGINLHIEGCTLVDSSLLINETKSLSVMATEWTKPTKTSAIMLDEVELVKLENSSITGTNLNFSSVEEGYGAVNIKRAHNITLKNVIFQNNSIIAQTFGNSKSSSFRKTKTHFLKDDSVGTAIFNVFAINDTLITVNNCTFKHNTGGSTGAISIVPSDSGDTLTNVVTIIEQTVFYNNSGMYGGALSGISQLKISDSHFIQNFAYFGGAIYGGSYDGTTIIEGTTFKNNSAAYTGGAILYVSNLTISDSDFTSNRAVYYGAGIAFQGNPGCSEDCDTILDSYLNMSQVFFTDNHFCDPKNIYNTQFMFSHDIDDIQAIQGSIGNSIFAQNTNIYASNVTIASHLDPVTPRIHNKTLYYNIEYAGTEIMVYSSSLNLKDIILDFTTMNSSQRYIDYFHFSGGSTDNGVGDFCKHGYVEGLCKEMHVEGLSMTCPIGYRPKLSFRVDMLYIPYEEPCSKLDNSTRLVCNYSSNFVYGCEQPAPGFYIADRGIYILESKESFLKSDAKPCPIPGGNCTQGLRPLDGYWGPLIENDTARFIKCIPEFCCTGSDCFDNSSCNTEANRAGILCTECIEDHSRSLFSEQCFPNEECGNYWILVLMAVIIILFAVLAVFGVLPYCTKYYGLLALISKGISEMRAHHRTQNVGHTGPRSQAAMQAGHGTDGGDVPEVEDIEETDGEHHESNEVKPRTIFLMCVVLIFYYSQDVTLYHVDVEPYTFPLLEKLLNTEVIHNLYNLNAGVLEQVGKYSCVMKDISPIGKLLLNISAYPLIYLTFGVIYIALFCRKTNNSGERWHKIRKNLETGFVLVAMIGFQKLTISALRLVNCVDVHESVLLMDSNTKCSQTKPVWIYIALCSIPFPFYLMFVTQKLTKRALSIMAFNFGLIFSGLYLIYWGFVSSWNTFKVRKHIKTPTRQHETQALLGNAQNESEELNIPSNYTTLGEVIVDGRPNSEQLHELYEELCDHLQGGYKAYLNGWLNWAGIVLLLRMLLVFSSVFIHDPVSRILFMLFISFINFTLFAVFRPCKNVNLNVLAILCQASIIIVGISYLILATLLRNQYQVPEDDPITQTLKIVIYICSVIIPGICIFLVLIDTAIGLLVCMTKCLIKSIKCIYTQVFIFMYKLLMGF